MAYDAPGQDAFYQSDVKAILEKRGLQVLGAALVGLAMILFMALVSHNPLDPSFLVASSEPVTNWLGGFGASVAAPLMLILGKASWALVCVPLVWGLRFLVAPYPLALVGRLILAPILLAVWALYAATLMPGPTWIHDFGLGGLFGDTVLLMLLQIFPGSAAAGAKILSVLTGLGTLFLGGYVLGFTFGDLRLWAARGFLACIKTSGLIAAGLAVAFAAARTGLADARERLAARKAQRAELRAAGIEGIEAAPTEYNTSYASPEAVQRVAAVIRSNPVMPVAGPEDRPAPLPEAPHRAEAPAMVALGEPGSDPRPSHSGLFARVPSLLKRAEPQMAAPMAEDVVDPEQPMEARVSSRIAEAIRSRSGPKTLLATPPAAEDPMMGLVSKVVARKQAQMAATPKAPPVVAPVAAVDASVPFTTQDWQRVATGDVPPLAEPDVSVAPAPVMPVMSVAEAPIADPEPKAVVHQMAVKPAPSKQAKAEAQPELAFADRAEAYEHPPLSLLETPTAIERHSLSDEALAENARMLESVLDDYGVKGEIVSVRPGPVVTMYELEPAPGLKASRVIGLSDDIARSMSALSARVSTVPGRSVIGIELPNENRERVVLRELLSAREFGDGSAKLPLALGKDIGGEAQIANLAKMPHLLIAGTTGSGKSVAINTMILSLLYKLSPEECRMIMIDPKMLELSVYDGIPHLLSPVVTDPKKAVVALKWVVGEMEDRYRKMSKMGVRNIDGYNSRVDDALAKNETFSRTVQTGFDDDTGEPIFESEEIQPVKLPYIVVVVDEMADLMMVAGKEIEACIQRLAQMARASGIHLIMATQRPSVDVITGTIKANFPTRISFQVTSKIDSRTILGEMGAEQLLGMGDMLYMAGGGKITRCHGPFVSDEEVEEIVAHLKSFGPPSYLSGVVEGPGEGASSDIDAVLGLTGGNTDGEDALYDQAVAIVAKDRKCSTSYIQRKLAIGYNKAARLVEQMEDNGLVTPANHVGKRDILIPEQA